MKKVLFLFLLSSILVNAQNVTINPSGITPALTGTYPRISYDEILALPSPVLGDEAYDLTFLCMRVYNGTRWVCSFQLPNEPVADLALIVSDGGISTDVASSMAVDAAGNVYVTGYFYGTTTFGNTSKTSAGGADIFISKYNSSGSLQWVQFVGGPSEDNANSIAVDASGNVYVTGFYRSTATFGSTSKTTEGVYDIFVAKYNSSGTLQWVRSAGGASLDAANSVAIDASGNVYVTGYYSGTATFGAISKTSVGSHDIFVAKYNPSGSLQWVQSAGAGGFFSDAANSVAVDASGNVYVTGYYQGTATFGAISKTSVGGYDIFIAKYNTNGSFQWVQSAGGTLSDIATSIAVDVSGNAYVTGYYRGTATFGATNKTSIGVSDTFIAKYKSNGSFQWVQSAGGVSEDNANSVAVDASGNVYVTGFYSGTASFGSISKISVGSADVFISKYNSIGSLQWVQTAGGTSYDKANSIALDASGNVFVIGRYSGTAKFGSTNKTSAGDDDIFVARISQ